MSASEKQPGDPVSLVQSHPSQWADNRYVYPVLSRRSHGISIGVNLNPDKICNFDCIYCQVNRRTEAETKFVDLDGVLREIEATLESFRTGAMFKDTKFAAVPPELRELRDIAFAGDGEPTTYVNFDEIVGAVADLRDRCGYEAVKLLLITNASMFHRPVVQRGLEVFDQRNGEIWAKLDAGTAEYYHFIDRTQIPFQRILDNITAAACLRPLVIQSLFMRVNDEPPSATEIDAFCDRLIEITDAGGQLSLIQVYTVARAPAESFVTPLSNTEVDAIATTVRTRTGLQVESFYGSI